MCQALCHLPLQLSSFVSTLCPAGWLPPWGGKVSTTRNMQDHIHAEKLGQTTPPSCYWPPPAQLSPLSSLMDSDLLFSFSVMSDSVTPWTAVHQASLSFTISQSLLKLMSIELMMPSNHLVLCHPLLFLAALGSFPMRWLFTSGGQSIGASASASVLPLNMQG